MTPMRLLPEAEEELRDAGHGGFSLRNLSAIASRVEVECS
jgi:hypothetical protein